MSDISAFPIVLPKDWDSVHEGMTLRDYFAGQALIGLLSRNDVPLAHAVPDNAYMIADAMIKARGE
jgi:hypothetical protein